MIRALIQYRFVDLASASQGHVGLRAYRLTSAFIDAYRSGKFDTQRSVRATSPSVGLLQAHQSLLQLDRQQARTHQHSRGGPRYCPILAFPHCLLVDCCDALNRITGYTIIPSLFLFASFPSGHSIVCATCIRVTLTPDLIIVVCSPGTIDGSSSSVVVLARHPPAALVDAVLPIASTRARSRQSRLASGRGPPTN